MIHFYCLAVEAGFYSDVVECLPVDPGTWVRFPAGAGKIFSLYDMCVTSLHSRDITATSHVHQECPRESKKINTCVSCFHCVPQQTIIQTCGKILTA